MGYPAVLWQSVGATLLGSFQFGESGSSADDISPDDSHSNKARQTSSTNGQLCVGYHLGVLNTALEQIAEDVGFDPATSGALVVSLLLLGAAAGSLSAGQLADRLGPKTALLINNAPLIAGSVLCMFAPIGSQGLPSLYAGGPTLSVCRAESWLLVAINMPGVHAVQSFLLPCLTATGEHAGRLLAGVGAGAASLYVPRYLTEVSPPAVRGIVSAQNQVRGRSDLGLSGARCLLA